MGLFRVRIIGQKLFGCKIQVCHLLWSWCWQSVYQICPSSKRFERVVVSNIMFSFNTLYANIREHRVCEIGPVPSHWMKNRCRILDLLNGATVQLLSFPWGQNLRFRSGLAVCATKQATLWRVEFFRATTGFECLCYGGIPMIHGAGIFTYTRWWFETFFIFTPIWGRFPIWLILFRWVETTNQYMNGWSLWGSISIGINIPASLPWIRHGEFSGNKHSSTVFFFRWFRLTRFFSSVMSTVGFSWPGYLPNGRKGSTIHPVTVA